VYETWSFTLMETSKLRIFEYTILRKIFGSKREELKGDPRQLHNG